MHAQALSHVTIHNLAEDRSGPARIIEIPGGTWFFGKLEEDPTSHRKSTLWFKPRGDSMAQTVICVATGAAFIGWRNVWEYHVADVEIFANLAPLPPAGTSPGSCLHPSEVNEVPKTQEE